MKGLRAVGEEPEADELRRLRRKVANLKPESDILKKAAIILGPSSNAPFSTAIGAANTEALPSETC